MLDQVWDFRSLGCYLNLLRLSQEYLWQVVASGDEVSPVQIFRDGRNLPLLEDSSKDVHLTCDFSGMGMEVHKTDGWWGKFAFPGGYI